MALRPSHLLASILLINAVFMLFVIAGFFGGGFGEDSYSAIQARLSASQQNNTSLKNALKSEIQRLEHKIDLSRKEIGSQGSAPVWLVIGMPTMFRESENYLSKTIDSIVKQLPQEGSSFYGRIKIVVMNVRPDVEHPQYIEAKQRLESNIHFIFADKPSGDNEDPTATDKGDQNHPGVKVRQQTRDVSTLLRMISEGLAGSTDFSYYMMAEDDFLFCPHFWQVSEYITAKAELYVPNWSAIRVSYGLNGVFLHGSDVGEVASYLREHLARRPPDHLTVEWFAAETEQSRAYLHDRRNAAFKYNILAHIGAVSTLRGGVSPSYPQCYEPLYEPVNFEIEAFNPTKCPNDDMWPCTAAENVKMSLIAWGK